VESSQQRDCKAIWRERSKVQPRARIRTRAFEAALEINLELVFLHSVEIDVALEHMRLRAWLNNKIESFGLRFCEMKALAVDSRLQETTRTADRWVIAQNSSTS
jgi:hypothetical protein